MQLPPVILLELVGSELTLERA